MPKTRRAVRLRLPSSLLLRLEGLAREEETTVAALVERAVRADLERPQGPAGAPAPKPFARPRRRFAASGA